MTTTDMRAEFEAHYGECPGRGLPRDLWEDRFRAFCNGYAAGRKQAKAETAHAAKFGAWWVANSPDWCLDASGNRVPDFSYDSTQEAERVWQAAYAAGRNAKREPLFWVLREQLEAQETTCQGRMWFVNPRNSAWVPVFAADPSVERAHGIGADHKEG